MPKKITPQSNDKTFFFSHDFYEDETNNFLQMIWLFFLYRKAIKKDEIYVFKIEIVPYLTPSQYQYWGILIQSLGISTESELWSQHI